MGNANKKNKRNRGKVMRKIIHKRRGEQQTQRQPQSFEELFGY